VIFSSLFFYIFLFFLLTFPITIWAYIFSYVGGSTGEQSKFQLGIFVGIVSLLPFLLLEHIYRLPFVSFFNVFQQFYILGTSFMSYPVFFFSCFFLALFLFLFSSLLALFFSARKQSLKRYFKDVILLSFLILALTASILVLSFIERNFSEFMPDISADIVVSRVYFTSFLSIVSYYMITAFGEELSKYLHFSQVFQTGQTSKHSALLWIIFVALWFVFLENILYCFSLVSTSPEKLYGTILFRSLFSLILHVLCSVVFLQAFLIFSHISKSLILACVAISIHTLFNVSVSFGFMPVVLCLFVWGYFYICKVLIYSESS
jgi:hypothetical protein